jgi:WD repeat-containing protein 35
LFGLQNGEIHMFDFNGNFLEKMRIHCLDSMGVKIAAIDWYDGRNGFISSDSPALAVCYSNGRCQIMKNEADESNFKQKNTKKKF